MTEEVSTWIAITASISPLIPLVCLFIYRKRQPKQNLILALSLFISFTFDMIAWGLIRWHDPDSYIISQNLYFITAFPAIMWFYHETLTKRSLKIIVRIFTIGFLIFASIFALNQGLNVSHYFTMTLSSILVTITSFFFVADLNLMDESNFLKNRFHETNIMLNTSLALYYFITIIMFSVTDYIYLHTSRENYLSFWALHNALNILKNFGITVAFYLSAKRIHSLTQLSKSERPTS